MRVRLKHVLGIGIGFLIDDYESLVIIWEMKSCIELEMVLNFLFKRVVILNTLDWLLELFADLFVVVLFNELIIILFPVILICNIVLFQKVAFIIRWLYFHRLYHIKSILVNICSSKLQFCRVTTFGYLRLNLWILTIIIVFNMESSSIVLVHDIGTACAGFWIFVLLF